MTEAKFRDRNLDVIETTIIEYSKRSAFIRNNYPADVESIEGVYKEYGNHKMDFTDCVVLDIGANIGGFCKRAYESGAKEVIAIEPDKFNSNLIQFNAPDALIINAVVGNENIESVEFCGVKSNKSSLSGGAGKTMKRSQVLFHIPQIKFNNLINKFKPDVVKIDIEGAEFDILSRYEFPNFVKQLIIEIHETNMDGPRHWLLFQLLQQFNIRKLLHTGAFWGSRRPNKYCAEYVTAHLIRT